MPKHYKGSKSAPKSAPKGTRSAPKTRGRLGQKDYGGRSAHKGIKKEGGY